MPVKYARYTLETKLQIVETARNGGVWEAVAVNLGVKYNTARD
ncbi:hypothetical protein PR003_g9835 [Phytophthora rubi]|uniref:HTH psq-type domain-containing protein n=1 Tax=Phytophthora rubi TaxID=129364 RepID=A0A6A4FLS8_9STRA|nr:hypothetical protein PR002_g19766 [Phytophthora rubi]KAE8996358.1 hypothetical protein PR001_g19882 [Phytophthora rubi]KAE9341703.1 hypothetical protein PR003_g9835 [Phytophthora rubi]